ncbi:hypothetical protein PWY87_13295 [Kribbella solani]|uniref:hypothetical protein n=1 Tax=Kribbella solani TaxID=236067 RepID=UPI0029A804DB|nr:hypothetical protein [Kribbella solani]MDX2968867.1 hypothetical protein [Kribbella solani]MDX3002656.1 hypothetical protein [Kribbella solani]
MALRRRRDSPVPDIGNGLFERIQQAVLRESGADQSLWNGWIGHTDRPSLRGGADGVGRIKFNQDSVVAPLREMFATGGRGATLQDWVQFRNALKTVIHEYAHLTAPKGIKIRDRLKSMQLLEAKAIEEGFTEAWSQSVVDRIARQVLPPELAAGVIAVKDQRGPHSYPAWEPAARAFADQVGIETGIAGDEVLRQVVVQQRDGKSWAAADLMFDASELPNLVPVKEQEAIREELAGEIHHGFAGLMDLKDNQDPAVNRRSVSRQTGMELADFAMDIIRSAEAYYGSGPEQQQSRGQQEQREQRGHQQTGGWSDQDQQQDQDLKAVQAAFGAQLPASEAVRVRQGEGGDGRSGSTTSGPATGRSTEPPAR